MNGTVEATDKNIKKILQKMTETYWDWHKKLPFALLTYRTLTWSSIRATPCYLGYDMEAVLPIEIEIPSLRILMEIKLEKTEWMRAWFDQLYFIEEKRMISLCHGQCYQRQIAQAYDKKVEPRIF